MKSFRFSCVARVLTMAALLAPSIIRAAEPAGIWEPAIRQFEEADRKNPPKEGGVVFVGSSSIRLWDLAASFPGMGALNRGFGGSQAADAARYADRIVIKYRPRLVIFYSGDNDLASKKSPETIRADVARFIDQVHQALPGTTILILSIKPSPARWALRDKQQATNALLRELAAGRKNVKFVDVGQVLLGADGRPRPELFLGDRLHLNREGYRRWSEVIAPLLRSDGS